MTIVSEAAELSFRQVANGWVFRPPNPWVFGDTPHYLVSDDQKARIVAVLSSPRPILLGLVMTLGLTAWVVAVAALTWMAGLRPESMSGIQAILMVAAFIIPVFVILPIYLAWQLRRLRPTLAGLPLTDERISRRDMRRAMGGTMSMRSLLLLAGLFGFNAILQSYDLWSGSARFRLFGDAGPIFSVITTAICGGVTLMYLWLALRKARQKQDPV